MLAKEWSDEFIQYTNMYKLIKLAFKCSQKLCHILYLLTTFLSPMNTHLYTHEKKLSHVLPHK